MTLPRVTTFDVETYLFSLGNMAPRIVCLSWAYRDEAKTKCGILVDRDQIEKWLHQNLDDALAGKGHLVGQYVAFDFACVLSNFPSTWDKAWKAYDQDRITCTAIRERLLDIASGEFRFYGDENGSHKNNYSLQDLARRNLQKEISKGEDTWRLRYAELDGVPLEDWPKAAIDYSVGDSVDTLAVFWKQVERAKYLGYPLPTEYEDVRADFALKLASNWGVITDQARVKTWWDKNVGRMNEISEQLVEVGLCSPKKAKGQKDLFLSEQDLSSSLPEVSQSMTATRELIEKTYPGDPPTTPKGKISTSAEVIEKCNSPILKALVEFKTIQKAAGTHVSKFFAPIIHARFDAVGAASDRTSCSKPNLQNVPRIPGIRECIRARDGHVFLACDFDSQEMRTLAQSCLDIVGCSQLAERYQADRFFDPHLEFAAKMLRIEIAEAKRLLSEKNPDVKEKRQQAKIANFGFPGGLGSETLVAFAKGWGVQIGSLTAKRLKEEYLQQWPEMPHYFRHVNTLVGDMGSGIQVVPQSGFQRGGIGYTDACNGYFQTLAAHASKKALWDVSKRCHTNERSFLYGSRPVLFIHDEVICETPEEVGHEASQEIEIVMVEAMMKYTPRVPPAASSTLMRNWSKGAERVFENKRLVPWEEGIQ